MSKYVRPHRRHNYNGMEGPHLVGMYSVLEDESISSDLSQLRYLTGNMNIIYADLSMHNVKKQIFEDVESGEIKKYISSPFKKYLVDHPKILHERSAANINDVQIFTSKEAIRKMAVLRYENCYNYFTICLAGGIIYIDNCQESKFGLSNHQSNIFKYKHYFKERESEDKHQGKKWGYVFKNYMLSDHPNKKPDPNIFHRSTKEFVCTYDIKVFGHKIHYWSRVDGAIPPQDHSFLNFDNEKALHELKKMDFVRIKTSLRAEDSNAFRYNKCREAWIQGTLENVDRVVIGFRTEDGILTGVKQYSLPELADKGHYWNPMSLQLSIKDFLDSVKTTFQRIIQGIDYSTFKDGIKEFPPISFCIMTNPKCSIGEIVLEPENINLETIENEYKLFLVLINEK